MMEHIQVTSYWYEIWSVIAMLLLIGLASVMMKGGILCQAFRQVTEISKQGLCVIILKYLFVLQLTFFALGNIMTNTFEIIAVSIAIFYLFIVCLSIGRGHKRGLFFYLYRWAVITFFFWVAIYDFGINSTWMLIEKSTQLSQNIWGLLVYISDLTISVKHFQINSYWYEMISFIAILIFVGPGQLFLNEESFRKKLHPVFEANIRGFIALVIEYLVVLQLTILVLGKFFHTKFELLSVALIIFSLLVVWLGYHKGLDKEHADFKSYFRVFEINLKDICYWCVVYYFVHKVVIVLLGDFISFEEDLVFSVVIMLALWLADISRDFITEDKKEIFRRLFWWFALFLFVYWVTKERFEINSTEKLVEKSIELGIFSWKSLIIIFSIIGEFFLKLRNLLYEPLAVLMVILMPTWVSCLLMSRKKFFCNAYLNASTIYALPIVDRLLFNGLEEEWKVKQNFRRLKKIAKIARYDYSYRVVNVATRIWCKELEYSMLYRRYSFTFNFLAKHCNYFVYLDPEEIFIKFRIKIKDLFSIVFESIFVSLALYWVSFGSIDSGWWYVLVVALALFSVLQARRTWNNAGITKKIWLKRFIHVFGGIGLIIAIFQIFWGVNFMVALRLLLQVLKSGIPFIKKSFFGKFVGNAWRLVIGFFRKLTYATISKGGIVLLQKFSLRFFIKIAMVCLTYQIFSFKFVKRFVRKHAGKAGKKALQTINKAKDRWQNEKFIAKLILFIIIMYLLAICDWHIFWPMLPKGTVGYLTKLFAWATKGLVALLKKFFGNKTIDLFMVFLAKRLSGRIAKFSPAMKHKMHMFMVWKLGRIMIKNRNRFFFLDDTVRDANRKARQEAIDNYKAFNNGEINIATMAGKTAWKTTKVATNLAKDGVIGTANVAYAGVSTTLTFAQKKTLVFFLAFQAFLKELIRLDRAPQAHTLQEHLKDMFFIFRQEEKVKKEKSVKEEDVKASLVQV